MNIVPNGDTVAVCHPRVGVGVLLVDERGRVLLTLRKLAPEAGCWSIVGGKLDYLETLQECAVREAREEVGLDVSIEALLCVTDHLLPQESQHWVSPAYLGRVGKGEAKNCEPQKTSQVTWFALANLPANLTMTARNAIAAYKRAIELKPSFAYYNNLGGIYGRAGKIDEASAAYQKAAELDPAQAAQAWRNFGITMYNANKYKDAVEPLKKATELDPKNPQSWYLLGTVLVGSMGFKKVGDKDVPDVQPGTIEAYQHAIDLDPNGPWGQQAKQGLDMLNQIAPGIATSVTTKKKKS